VTDIDTAEAFSQSWNNLPAGSVYSVEQIWDWMIPLSASDFKDKSILELGCGNGGILLHLASCSPRKLVGVDLGASVVSARKNLQLYSVEIIQTDLTDFVAPQQFDIVICIGVLHHLQSPKAGFDSVLRNTIPGGLFHCWVYAHEGNSFVRIFIEPLRRLCSQLPWWITKYCVATPLAIPMYFLAKLIARYKPLEKIPMGPYLRWIAKAPFLFVRHVIFDQLVTPHTIYIERSTIENWLSDPLIDQSSCYISMRNGNSWRFGGRIKQT
jgi:SAM-dependent methyltransferase